MSRLLDNDFYIIVVDGTYIIARKVIMRFCDVGWLRKIEINRLYFIASMVCATQVT
jgi:hypothetical protein